MNGVTDRESFVVNNQVFEFDNNGNVAAGSDPKNGVGIWYLFPDKPVGPSANYNMMEFREARATPLGVRILNNELKCVT